MFRRFDSGLLASMPRRHRGGRVWDWGMGCVQSKRASRDDPSAAGESDRQRELEELSNALKNVVKGRKEGMEVARGVEREKVTRAGDSPATERRRPRPEPYLRSQRGWPSWLLDALGDGIQDWTPRCANSFEKLDKVVMIRKP